MEADTKKIKLSDLQETIFTAIVKKSGLTITELAKITGQKAPVISTGIKTLVQKKVISETKVKGGENTYETIPGAEKKSETAPTKEKSPVEKKVSAEKAQAEKAPAPKRERSSYMKRDMTLYSLPDGVKLKKGRFCLAMVKLFVADNPKTTLAELEVAFPKDKLQKAYGVFQKTSEIKKKEIEKRFFMGADEIIKLSDGSVGITREWGSSNAPNFVTHCQKVLGYKIKVHSEG
jgi:hypothetical protein